jgi:hypothetical protein
MPSSSSSGPLSIRMSPIRQVRLSQPQPLAQMHRQGPTRHELLATGCDGSFPPPAKDSFACLMLSSNGKPSRGFVQPSCTIRSCLSAENGRHAGRHRTGIVIQSPATDTRVRGDRPTNYRSREAALRAGDGQRRDGQKRTRTRVIAMICRHEYDASLRGIWLHGCLDEPVIHSLGWLKAVLGGKRSFCKRRTPRIETNAVDGSCNWRLERGPRKERDRSRLCPP